MKTSKENLADDLVKRWPSLPYLSLGVWLAWYQGIFWFSGTKHAEVALPHLYLISAIVFGATLLAMPLLINITKRMLSHTAVIIGAGGLACFGSVLAIASYIPSLQLFAEQGQVFFWTGSILKGVATAVFVMKIGELFGMLSPRLNFLYVGLAQIVVAVIYSAIASMPPLSLSLNASSLIFGGLFCSLPLLAALLAGCCRKAAVGKTVEDYKETIKHLPFEFWRLTALTALLALMTYMVKAMAFSEQPSTTLFGSSYAILVHLLLGGLMIIVALRLKTRYINFGKIILVLAIIVACSIACIPVIGSAGLIWNPLFYIVSTVFEFLIWSMLAIIVFQRKVSSIIVFGFGRGSFVLASAFGWALGIFVVPVFISPSNSFVIWLMCAGVVLLLSLLLFSEKISERLFLSGGDEESSFENIMSMSTIEKSSNQDNQEKQEKRDDFEQAVERLAKSNGLSVRETETFSYLAKGYSSSAIAEKLLVSWNTARSHTQNVYMKLSVHSRQELIVLIEKEIETFSKQA
ncbi:MAG: helix-turn-helix transcriptional regulator [Coriobacteriia bacterium]|nr:helix-turn-helix transcriptional regulator [Coriobacteriia bacterium]